MRTLLTCTLVLMISFSGLSQKKQIKKVNSTKNNIPTEEINIANQIHNEIEDITVDTIHITKGKPTFLLIQINGQNTFSEIDRREIKELNNNFDKTKNDIIDIKRHSFIIFENNQTLDLSNFKNSYAAKAFWSGKLKEQIQTEEGLENSTEFFAKQLKIKKESSYVIDARKYKKELSPFIKKTNITEKSKEVLNAFLKQHTTPFTEEENVFEQNIDKVKMINIYVSERKIKKALVKSIEFNEKGQPTRVINKNIKGETDSEKKFIYDNGMLTKIIEGDMTKSYSYNDGKMISVNKNEEAESIDLFWLENGVLLDKNYTLFNDEKQAYHNTIVATKLEDNCRIKTYNDKIIRKDCFTKKGEFPFMYTYTSFQDEEILQVYKTKMVKKNESVYEGYLSSSDDPKKYKDNFILTGTFQLNDKKQITSFSSIKQKDKPERTVKIEYIYYQ